MTREQMNRLQDQITKLQTDMYYRSGETLHIKTFVPVYGYITSGRAVMAFVVHTGKSMKHITSVSVTQMYGLIRGVNGFINTNTTVDWVTVSGITISTYIVSDYLLLLTVDSTTALSNATGDTPVVYAPGQTTGLVLTFGE